MTTSRPSSAKNSWEYPEEKAFCVEDSIFLRAASANSAGIAIKRGSAPVLYSVSVWPALCSTYAAESAHVIKVEL